MSSSPSNRWSFVKAVGYYVSCAVRASHSLSASLPCRSASSRSAHARCPQNLSALHVKTANHCLNWLVAQIVHAAEFGLNKNMPDFSLPQKSSFTMQILKSKYAWELLNFSSKQEMPSGFPCMLWGVLHQISLGIWWLVCATKEAS